MNTILYVFQWEIALLIMTSYCVENDLMNDLLIAVREKSYFYQHRIS